MDLMVLKSHWNMGNLGNPHLAEGTLRPGQLRELFEHTGSRDNCFFILPTQLSLEEAVGSVRPVGFCLLGAAHVPAAEGIRTASPSKAVGL